MKTSIFNEIVFMCHQQTGWVWNTVNHFFKKHKLDYIHVDPDNSLNSSWSRIRETPKLVIHWESGHRLGGAVIEELFEIEPFFELEDKLVVITSDPRNEDLVYFSELGIQTIIEIRNNQIDINNGTKKLQEIFFNEPPLEFKQSKLWRKLFISLDKINSSTPSADLTRLRSQIEKVGDLDGKKSPRYFHSLGIYYNQTGHLDSAEEQWQKALQIDGNYHPSKMRIVELYCQRGEIDKALFILKGSQVRNKNNISRLVKMGEIHFELKDIQKAEHYFLSALDRNKFCGRALNGLASIRFEQGKLEESRRLLAQSSLAAKVASTLNQQGIVLVRESKFEEALEHYSKAQYVLPQQDKSPMLFFNMGLCYSRWGKIQPAKKFLQLALIKEPNYTKARNLLDQLNAA